MSALRTYAVSATRTVVEMFMDGRPMLVGRPREGFFFAHMIGPRGEPAGSFRIIPWSDSWSTEIGLQLGTAAYLENRPPIPLPMIVYKPLVHWTPPKVEPAATIPTPRSTGQTNGSERNGTHRNRSNLDSLSYSPSVDFAIGNDDPEPVDATRGSIDDLISTLRQTGSTGSDADLRALAMEIQGRT